jgi:hypothetical protein
MTGEGFSVRYFESAEIGARGASRQYQPFLEGERK